jgi:hypothetical protein
MRNDLTACDGPQLANAASIGRGGSRRRRTMRCGLLALPLALVLIAPGASALAAEATTGYSQTTPAPKTQTTPAPKQETAPTQTSSAPAKEAQPAKTGSEPKATTGQAKALPFTGLDLRWVTLGGLLLVSMGMSIVVVQRRQRAGR